MRMKQGPKKRYKELLEKKEKYEAKLKELYKNFRGVIHEDSSSEMKYTQIKVIEGFLDSIEEELKQMEESKRKV
jgi:Ni,Fe-hydrogenase III component G